MKNIRTFRLFFFLTICVNFLFTSCYDDYVDDYDSTMYFSSQQPLRTVIADRSMDIKVGVAISGKRNVDTKDWADFILDSSLLEGTELELMPESYYTLSNSNRMLVRDKAVAIADVTISFTDAFYADPLTMTTHYALPFRIVETSCDQINEQKSYSIVAVKYESTYAGTYYVQGNVDTLGEGGEVVSSEVYSDIDLSDNITRKLTTVDKTHLIRQGVANVPVANDKESIALSIEGDRVVVSSRDGIDGAIDIFDASGSYDNEAHAIQLNYSYVKDNVTFRVSETLTLRQDILLDLRYEEWD